MRLHWVMFLWITVAGCADDGSTRADPIDVGAVDATTLDAGGEAGVDADTPDSALVDAARDADIDATPDAMAPRRCSAPPPNPATGQTDGAR